MPSNPTLPKDVIEQAAEALLAVSSNPEAVKFLREEGMTPWKNALAEVDAIAPLIIEWARKDQAEGVWDSAIAAQRKYADYETVPRPLNPYRAQFAPETSDFGIHPMRGAVQKSAVTGRYIIPRRQEPPMTTSDPTQRALDQYFKPDGRLSLSEQASDLAEALRTEQSARQELLESHQQAWNNAALWKEDRDALQQRIDAALAVVDNPGNWLQGDDGSRSRVRAALTAPAESKEPDHAD